MYHRFEEPYILVRHSLLISYVVWSTPLLNFCSIFPYQAEVELAFLSSSRWTTLFHIYYLLILYERYCLRAKPGPARDLFSSRGPTPPRLNSSLCLSVCLAACLHSMRRSFSANYRLDARVYAGDLDASAAGLGLDKFMAVIPINLIWSHWCAIRQKRG